MHFSVGRSAGDCSIGAPNRPCRHRFCHGGAPGGQGAGARSRCEERACIGVFQGGAPGGQGAGAHSRGAEQVCVEVCHGGTPGRPRDASAHCYVGCCVDQRLVAQVGPLACYARGPTACGVVLQGKRSDLTPPPFILLRLLPLIAPRGQRWCVEFVSSRRSCFSPDPGP